MAVQQSTSDHAEDVLLSGIETAVEEISDRDNRNAALIKTIIESVNGLRSLLGVVRAH
jgi:hypothetical protein